MQDLNKYPLCVDLDGTLIRTDIMFESIFLLLKKNIFYIFMLPIWLMKGRYELKEQLAKRVGPNVDILPYNEEIIRISEAAHAAGREVYLVTASYHTIAEKVGERFTFFKETIASRDGINLVGKTKSNLLVKRFGKGQFDYIGDSYKDRFVWQNSNGKILVNCSDEIKNEFQSAATQIIDDKSKSKLKILTEQLRVYQWVKNTLVFLPMLLAHVIDQSMVISSTLTFFALSFMASAIYVINDLFDIEADRKHIDKKNRPLASGRLKILTAAKLVPVLFVIAVLLAYFAKGFDTMGVILLYFVVTVLYSLWFKRLNMADIIILAGLYTLRLLLGGVATDTLISHWLLSFSMFFFLSLASLKRFIELRSIELNNSNKSVRGYNTDDTTLMMIIGVASGLISVLVYVLYINSPAIVVLYKNHVVMYLIAPVILYWITRTWLLANRGHIHHDPVVFAIRDKASHLVIMIIFILSVIGML
ncbi:MAG: UbiA family prenyltransferase [Desulfobulbaceae bacterium]|nr:UbiA family prenyltransferase [Candidatus Kapabacteria bacterium]MBS4000413.1 UbiA family prenyltransferase [Desulfobulbaceae bacterium]